MIVMKFGGSSVAKPERIRNVGEIVRRSLPKKPVVVVSALGGVTDQLIMLANRALQGSVSIRDLMRRHTETCEALGLPPDLCAPFFFQLEDLLRGISLVGELTPRSLDFVVSFGERMSATILAAHLRAVGVPARAIPADEAGLVTDSEFGGATPLRSTYRNIPARLRKLLRTKEVPVITGYIARDREGNVTTLGRDGSDYTATIFGAALRVDEVQIWTDVDGVMTADPSVCRSALPIDVLSFEEASELAWYGARVLHPSTLLPAMERKVPVRVLNTMRPSSPGTVIVPTKAARDGVVRSIAYKEDQYLINVVSTRMFQQHGFMQRMFDIFGRHKVVVNQIATSEISVSLTTDSDRNLKAAAEELRKFASVELEGGKTIVCVVGSAIRGAHDIPARIFTTLARAGVTPQLISQGATRVNVSFLIDNKEIPATVKALHKAFFGKSRRPTAGG
ncbi:MAG: aspartate kinase [Planctomycetales bacterium]|nr:aspartate kinase [Planctomycetales bacterium]